jgi:hypothetical protein
MKFVGSSKKSISGLSKSTFARAIFVLSHQLTSFNFLSNRPKIQIPLTTL